MFFEQSQKIEDEKKWRKVLDGLPQGCTILNFNRNPLYYNEAILDILDVFNQQKQLEQLSYEEQIEKFLASVTNLIPCENQLLHDSEFFQDISQSSKMSKFVFTHQRTVREEDNYSQKPFQFEKNVHSARERSLDYNSIRKVTQVRQNGNSLETDYSKNNNINSNENLSFNEVLATLKAYFDNKKLKQEQTELADFFDQNLYFTFNTKLQINQEIKSFSIGIRGFKFNLSDCFLVMFSETSQREEIMKLKEISQYKSKLMASVSHEIRSPLSGSIGMVQCSINDQRIPQECKTEYLIPTLNAQKHLLFLINDILDYSQMKADKLRIVHKDFKIRELIGDLVKLISLPAQQKSLNIIVDIADNVPILIGSDPNRLAQIIMNLLGNSIKFTFSGFIKITLWQDQAEFISFSVEDSGIGIKQEDLSKLFKVFGKLDDTENLSINPTGVGLGLIISQSLAQRLGGTNNKNGITVESDYGKGTKFTFKIQDKCINYIKQFVKQRLISQTEIGDIDDPLTNTLFRKMIKVKSLTQKYTLNDLNKQQQQQLKCNCQKILIVDYNPFNVVTHSKLIKFIHKTCDIDSANNGQEAIDKIIQRNHNKCKLNCKIYNIIFMDFLMPVMDFLMPVMNGSEATKKIKQMTTNQIIPFIPINATTGLTLKENIDECYKAGMDDVISKPIEIESLKDKLKEWFNHNKNSIKSA